MIVALAILIHLLFVFAVVKIITPAYYKNVIVNLLPKEKGEGFLIFLIIGLAVFSWYNRSRIKILTAARKPFPDFVSNGRDILYVVLLLVIPIVPIIIVFWKR